MRVLIHDYAGHPFQIELSRVLAGRGYEIFHIFCSSLNGPQGSMLERDGDSENLRIIPLDAPNPIDKQSVFRRFGNEFAYGRRLCRRVDEIAPDLVISANAPTHVQALLQGRGRSRVRPMVLWLQDLYGLAIRSVYSRRSALAASLISYPFVVADRWLAQSADHVIVIAQEFCEPLGLDPTSFDVTLIENWATLNEMPVLSKDNEWSRDHGLESTRNFVYAGTLGAKHNPRLLLDLAERYRHVEDVRVVVAASGSGMNWLRRQAVGQGVTNLRLFEPVSYGDLPNVLAMADVQVALLESDAGAFSVPSKVLTYLCAGRPILASIPRENLASSIISFGAAGVTVEPGDDDEFLRAARMLIDQPGLGEELGRNGRKYAEATFNVERIANRFEAILQKVSGA